MLVAVLVAGGGASSAAEPADSTSAAAEREADQPRLWEPEQAVAYLLGGPVSPAVGDVPARVWDGALGSGISRALFGTYHLVLSSQDAGGCVFSPSCSRFSQSAMGTCGPIQGALLTLDRLLRDHPFAVSSYARAEGGRLLRDEPARYCLTRGE